MLFVLTLSIQFFITKEKNELNEKKRRQRKKQRNEMEKASRSCDVKINNILRFLEKGTEEI